MRFRLPAALSQVAKTPMVERRCQACFLALATCTAAKAPDPKALWIMNLTLTLPLTLLCRATVHGSMRVLIAEDHDLVCESLASLFQIDGICEMVTRKSLDSTVQVVCWPDTLDFVLLCYNMPRKTGLEGLAQKIEANNRRPVSIPSGSILRGLVQQAIDAI